MEIGIDKIGMYTPNQYVDLVELAIHRKIDPDKFTIGIGQDKMAVAPLSQDTISMAANAAAQILSDADKAAIDLVILGTESGVDNSKAGALYVQRLLGISNKARVLEIKEACYGATAGLQFAKLHIAQNPKAKALVIGSDIARYGLDTSGEVTQGAGAVALLVAANPRILALDMRSAYYSSEINDFWRPLDQLIAEVDGKYSNEAYIKFFQMVFEDYQQQTGYQLSDFAAMVFHLPYTKMGLKALRKVLDQTDAAHQDSLQQHYQQSTLYSRRIGNIYTGSLYLAFLSLINNDMTLQPGMRIGLYSYGSGAVGEFFSGTLQGNYLDMLDPMHYLEMFENRTKLSIAEYEAQFKKQLTPGIEAQKLITTDLNAPYYFAGIQAKQRQYKAGAKSV
ncbi:hydroxymethylglutaryl-CoA synthase [Agrilactobacillus composti DSM 18527 = JCM 14202]|uniref:Hydroxymethylglutaryl-CoA synthase n=1 Tax=Agrilactobacillus composti DSM 18527 = JCM 14202 TaxID=1423734 RepID=A0A0R1XNE6_9LACO|nr:hydroxymethylglutaryl-CoA synthase [Agrilactobacillus composti]KRM31457.1 hydroxymethylglutaryl-CoA synthase [Agrilactobacillus composti DSM 18527 = JCM 14202]